VGSLFQHATPTTPRTKLTFPLSPFSSLLRF
jgi:hypothetical protein